MRVRKATLQDLPRLVEFTRAEADEAEGRASPPALLEKGIRRALEDPAVAMYWLLVDDDGAALGHVSALREWSDWNAGDYWWVQSMYIRPAQRGKGYVRLLMETVEDEMRRHGGVELRLYVHEDNVPAKKAYDKAGFVTLPYRIMALRKGDGGAGSA